jgi:ABC-type multidrug transport system fused ATPase/permease subunit
MCGLTDVLRDDLQQLRIDELQISKKFRKLLIVTMGFCKYCDKNLCGIKTNITVAYISPVAAPIVTFAVFSVMARNGSDGNTLDTAKIFTSLSLFSLLTEPLGSLIMALASLMGGVGSFQRIQAFLSLEPRIEKRRYPSLSSHHGSTSDFGYDTDKDSQKSRFSLEIRELNPSGSNAVIVDNGCFGWKKDKPTEGLQSINMTVPRAKITMVVGPVGCGKSTLLKGILGELPVMGGTVQISSLRIALCEQTPWHMNGTVQQTIVGVSDFDQRWYASVVRSCALDEDLRQLPQGDQTQVGSKGIALSGGQSQRIVSHPAY